MATRIPESNSTCSSDINGQQQQQEPHLVGRVHHSHSLYQRLSVKSGQVHTLSVPKLREILTQLKLSARYEYKLTKYTA